MSTLLQNKITQYNYNYNSDLTRTITKVGAVTSTSTYTYNHAGDRISHTANGVTTFDPNQYTSKTGTTNRKYLYNGSDLIATIETTPATTTKYITHFDHLGGTNIVTGHNTGNPVQVLDYYPFGSIRVDTSSTTYDSIHKYIGQEYDEESGQSYLNARYLNNTRGQFASEDPLHLAIGDPSKFAELMPTLTMQEYLRNPQALNSYSYAGNNPIRFSDPQGLWYGEFSVGGDFLFFNASAGVRFDGAGSEGFVSGGPSVGVSGPVQASFSSGNLSHKTQISVSRNVELMAGAGMGMSREGSYDYKRPLSLGRDQKTSYSTNVGLGGGVSQKYTLSTPLVTYGSNSSKVSPSSNEQSSAKSYSKLVSSLNKLVSALRLYVKSKNTKKNKS